MVRWDKLEQILADTADLTREESEVLIRWLSLPATEFETEIESARRSNA